MNTDNNSPSQPPPSFRPPQPPKTPQKSSSTKSTTAMGIIGAVVGGALATVLWFLLIRLTGYEIGYAAIGVGVLVGIGTRLLAEDEGQTLGIIAAIGACCAILGGRYIALHEQLEKARGEYLQVCQKLIKVADENDDEFREQLANLANLEVAGRRINPDDITDEQLDAFEESVLPTCKRFVAQTPAQQRAYIRKISDVSLFDGFAFLWILLGVVTAFGIAAKGELS